MKYIFVTGGVMSSVGKGVSTASIGKILQSRGYRVSLVKCDMYVNIDAGTMRPTEHGEVFVGEDGIEADQDLGNYERFTDMTTGRDNYVTTGQVYQSVIERERGFGYEGEDVEVVPDIPNEIIRRINLAARKAKAEIVIVRLRNKRPDEPKSAIEGYHKEENACGYKISGRGSHTFGDY